MHRRARLVPIIATTAALVMAGAGPASAATDPDVVYLLVSTPGDSGSTDSFGTAAKSDAALTALPDAFTGVQPSGLEILGNTGYALVPRWNGPVFETTLATWDIDSGALLTQTPIAFDTGSPLYAPDWPDAYPEFIGLDSADGVRLQTVVCVWGATAGCFLGTLDPATAVFTATVDVSAARAVTHSSPNELATDPLSGVTSIFYDGYDPQTDATTPWVLAVAGGAAGTPQPMTGTVAAIRGGAPSGADYASDGTLWLVYSPDYDESTPDFAQPQLLSFAPRAAIATATPTVVGDLASDDPAALSIRALQLLAVASWTPEVVPPTTTPAATLPDTGAASAFGAGIAAALLLLAGSLALLPLLIRRRA